MNQSTDQQLLRDYAERRSDTAFTELVRRHVDLVYSAALRMVRDGHLADDVTQGVFVALANNAPQLADCPALEGWLHGTTRNLAANIVRAEVRRRNREQEAAIMNEMLSPGADVNWKHIAPHLDEALGELNGPERDALLLRYFKNHDFRAVGLALGVSDDTAQKRVSRAIEKLRDIFAKRKITIGAGGLVVLISANAVQSAPVGLIATISGAALAGTAVTTSTIIATTKTIAMTTLQKAFVTVTVAVLAGAGLYEAKQANDARIEAQQLREQQASFQQLQNSFADATNQLADLSNELMNARKNNLELLKLRGEVGTLKNELAQDQAAQAASLSSSGEQTNASTAKPPLVRKMENAKNLVRAALYDFPDRHGGQFPTNWDQLAGAFDRAERQSLNPGDVMPDTAADFSQMTNEFDLLYSAPASTLYSATNFHDVVVLRGKQPFQTPDGKWVQVYGFADGHSQVMSEPPEGFDAWEQQHTAAVPSQ